MKLSQKQINERISSATVSVFLIKDQDSDEDNPVYYMCPIGWDRDKAEKANLCHRGYQPEHLKHIGVQQYDPDCFSFLENAESEGMEIYDFPCLPIYNELIDFYPGLFDGEWKEGNRIADRLTDDELSPVAKREIGLIDRLLGIQPEPQSIDPLELSPETGCVEGIGGGIYIHYSAKNDEEAIAVDAPATMCVDEVNYRIENFIDQHVDLASAVINGDRVHYRQLTEPTESGFVLERDPELVDRLLTNRFGFDRHATR